MLRSNVAKCIILRSNVARFTMLRSNVARCIMLRNNVAGFTILRNNVARCTLGTIQMWGAMNTYGSPEFTIPLTAVHQVYRNRFSSFVHLVHVTTSVVTL